MTKGSIGYIKHTKKKNLTYGITGIAAMFVIYLMGLMVTGTNGNLGTLVAVLVALPAAQMLTRYFSLSKYKSLEADWSSKLTLTSDQRYLYELIIVQGKSNYFIEAALISDSGLALIGVNKDTGKVIAKMLKHKGCEVPVYTFESLETYSQGDIGESIVGNDLQQTIYDKLLENAL